MARLDDAPETAAAPETRALQIEALHENTVST